MTIGTPERATRWRLAINYLNKGTRDIAARVNSKEARRVLPVGLHDAARLRLAFLLAAESLDDLRAWQGLNLHALRKDREGQYAIRINDKYQICFRWMDGEADSIEITNYR